MTSSGVSHFDEKSGIVSCTTEWGTWHQTANEVSVLVNTDKGTRGKEVQVSIKPSLLSCSVRGKELFKGAPFDTVIEDESTWTLEDGGSLLRIQLVKANPRKDDCWLALLKDMSFAPDPFTLKEMRKKLDLEQFQLENPGFDFSGAKLDKRYEDKALNKMEEALHQKTN